jgi:hypothetical protein
MRRVLVLTVCDKNWNADNAAYVCKSLHFIAQRIAHTPLGAVKEVYNWVKVHITESGGTQRFLVVG